ncbi:MAG: Eco57I restriction-modification methylase domain-containing protein [Lentisphaeria bacterium]|nr:Eco57I restriction-modification methylase domain-containing protein [Lentisphaeria bacterium]
MVKAPDYCFRIGGTRKFFLETKKPSVNIKADTHPAYQLRRYAWSAKLPLSILTDFEEFAVYDCRARPVQSDKASKSRIMYLKFDEYIDRWDEIAAIFAREAILKGSFDKFADSAKGKRGTAEVDDEFLKEIESWREILAKNIALRNPRISSRELNFAVQRTIDRLVFLRICEDRGIEPYGRLQALGNGVRTYPRLCELFRMADDRYNSGLFHFKTEKGRADTPDELSLTLSVDDKVLKALLKRMYYPESPYEFSVLPADILGQVYERFLGKVIRLTAGHQAKIEEKPEVRKAGGVYYTPTYIVDYIVENTVGKLLAGSTPKKASKLRILDPACGSGSFLIGAYQHLLDWHRDWYVKDNPEKYARGKTPVLYQGRGEEWKLTTAERKRILINNIYGVDIDQQAVEVTKLSLLLKVLEGESEQTLSNQLMLFNERALPDLGGNIKCGNSLIGPDFYTTGQPTLFDMEETYRINAFDWEAEFPEILNRKDQSSLKLRPASAKGVKEEDKGGFDAVIGNPPYVRIQAMKEWAPTEVDFCRQRYRSASAGNYDIYTVFVEKGLALLNSVGCLGFILPSKFFNAKYGRPLRGIIAEGQHLAHVVHFGAQQVFPGVATYTCLMFLDKSGADECFFVKVNDLGAWRRDLMGIAEPEGPPDRIEMNEAAAVYRVRQIKTDSQTTSGKIPAKLIGDDEWNFAVGKNAKLLERIHREKTKLGDVADIFVGLQTSADKIFVVSDEDRIEQRLTRPLLLTGHLSAYAPPVASARIVFPYQILNNVAQLMPPDFMAQHCPEGWFYLNKHRNTLMNRENGKWRHDAWYAFGRSQNLTKMDAPKLIIQVTALKPTVMLDENGICMTGGGSGPFYGVRPKMEGMPLKYLLGMLNSKLFGMIIRAQSTDLRGGYIKFSKQYIETAPIAFSKNDPRNDRLVALVERMLELNKQLQAAKTAHDKTVLQRQIDATDAQIDRLVYELYDLTDEEINIVEDSGRRQA